MCSCTDLDLFGIASIYLVLTLGVACFVLFPFEDVCFSVGSDHGQLHGDRHSFLYCLVL